MPQYRVSPAAQQDLEAILAWTQRMFGEPGRLRYEALLVQAIRDVASNPQRPGCLARPELASNVFTYHLHSSRDRVSRPADRVRHARHFLLCRIGKDSALEIIRVLHDSMDLPRNLPSDDEPPV